MFFRYVYLYIDYWQTIYKIICLYINMNAIFISQNLTGVWKSEIAKINIFIHWGIVNGGNKNRCKIADVKKQ